MSNRTVIVGASAAGLRCAARLRRLDPKRSIVVVEENEVFSVAACGMPYVLSGDITDASALRKTGDGLVRDASYFQSVKQVEVMVGHRACELDTQAKQLIVESKSDKQTLAYDDLVLATGAQPRKLKDQPEHPRVRSFHVFEDIAPLDQALKRGQIERVVIIGAGLVGIELAEAFRSLWDAEVCIVEAQAHPLPQLLDPATGAMVQHELEKAEVELHCNQQVQSIEADDNGVTVFAGSEQYRGDMAIVAFGLQPAVSLAQQSGIHIGSLGAIEVDERFATSAPHVYAVGDCIQVQDAVLDRSIYRPLGSLANRQGRTLANILSGREDRFPKVASATAVKVFDLNVACVGITLAQAIEHGVCAQAVWTSPHDRADYWPDSKNIFIQMVYDTDSQRVLGVQVVGPGECAKRVDVATQLIRFGVKLADFAHIEHAYAPPYAPAIEPLAACAMVAQNRLDGLDVAAPCDSLGGDVLDVRHDFERENQPVKAEEIREIDQGDLTCHLAELGKGPWTVVCARGVRSAEAARLLRNHGIEARYLAGGLAWQLLMGRG